jgi:hypothetical protein
MTLLASIKSISENYSENKLMKSSVTAKKEEEEE